MKIDALQPEIVTVLKALADLDIDHLSNRPDDYPLFGINDTQINVGAVRLARAILVLIYKGDKK